MFWRIKNVCYLEQIPAEQPCTPARPLEFPLCLHLLEGSLFCNGGTDFALCGRSCFPWHSQDDLVIPLIKCVSREKLCDRQGDPVRLAKCWWRFCLGQAAGEEVLGGAGTRSGGAFLGPIVGSEVQCTSLRLLELCAFVCTRVWGHVYVHMPFGYLCSDPMIETSWISTTESSQLDHFSIRPCSHSSK